MASTWRHYPWLLGLAAAPLLGGSVGLEGKAVVALLFGVSLFLMVLHAGESTTRSPVVPALLAFLAAIVIVLGLIPWPASWVQMASPGHFLLADAFPVGSPAATGSEDAMRLSLSPWRTVSRLTDLFLLGAAFWLSRLAAGNRNFGGSLVWSVTTGIGLLAVAECWIKMSQTTVVLGIWQDPAGHGGATFANRNHFASWVYVGGLFVAGWILRQTAPLTGARLGATLVIPSNWKEAAFHFVVVAVGFGAAVGSGSRGAMSVLVVGSLIWLLLLAKRGRRRGRWFALGVGAFVMLVVLLSMAGYLSARLATSGHDFAFKAAIWQDALSIWQRFPWFGTGLGTFSVVFNHFKTGHGDATFLHAENDFVELLMEQGLAGAAVWSALGLCLACRLWRFVARASLPEPELAFGAMAALAGFLTHSLVEFVWHIPANAILAVVLLGYLVGARDVVRRPSVLAPPGRVRVWVNLAGATAIMVLGMLQGTSTIYWHRAREAGTGMATRDFLRQATELWPWSTARELAAIRAEIALLPEVPTPLELARVERRLERGIRGDPYDWRLRLEQAWFELHYGGDQAAAVAQAWRVVRLNPLQGQIPFQFATHLAPIDAEEAEAFLRAVATRREDEQRRVLELAWQLNPDPSALWPYTPSTEAGLRVLAEFARQKNLPELARQASQFNLN